MKNHFTKRVFRDIKNSVLLVFAQFLIVGNIFANGEEGSGKKLLPPPTPTVTLALPPSAGSTCYSVLTATGCGAALTYWYNGSTYFSNSNPLIVSSNNPYTLKAVCYDSGLGQFGSYSPEYKTFSATYTEIVPIASTICTGASVTLNASSASAGLNYQWQRNFSNISGATSSSYSATLAGTYTVIASNASCSSTTPGATVTVITPSTPTISTSFSGTCGSQTVTMSTQASLPAGTFQWKLAGSNISGATSSSYMTNVPGVYTVDYTSSGCTATSLSYTFTQNTAPVITLNPAVSPSCSSTLSATGCLGTVNWERNIGGWGYYTSGTSISVPVSANPPNYRANCFQNGCSSAVSNEVKAIPNNFTEITPAASTICAGGSVLLNASSTFSGLTYQWQRNFSNISGATSSSYSATLAGSYTLIATNGSCSYTASGSVTVVNPPTLSITSSTTSPATISNGQSLVLTANGCSGGTVLWSNSATTPSITVTPSSNTTYTFTCTQPPCVAISSGFVINVNPLLPPTITSSSVSTCTGTSVMLMATACAGGGTVTWSTAQTGLSISVSPSVTTSYTATCTVGAVTSTNSTPLSISVFNGAITSLASGNWNNPTTWSCNCVPASCNDVTVDTGHTVTIPATEKGKLKNLTIKGIVDVKNTGTMALK
jgi:hypothetical protein